MLEKSAFIILCLLFVTVDASAQLNRTHFYGEDKFANPISLTSFMLAGLQHDKNLGDCYDVAKDRTEVTRIDVNGDHKPEILIKIGCGNSSTSYLFWILSKRGKGYKPIFFVGTMGIDFTKRNRLGYRGIKAVGCNGNTCSHETFAFNGRRYGVERAWTTPNN